MYVSRVLDRQLLNGWCHRHQNRRLCSHSHAHESVFSYFWDSYFLSYGEFVELIKMHRYGGWQHSVGQTVRVSPLY